MYEENVETVALTNRDQNNGLNSRFNQISPHKIIENGMFELNFECERLIGLILALMFCLN